MLQNKRSTELRFQTLKSLLIFVDVFSPLNSVIFTAFIKCKASLQNKPLPAQTDDIYHKRYQDKAVTLSEF